MIEHLRKKPVTVETMRWDGTPERLAAIRDWVANTNLHPGAVLYDDQAGLRVWNEEERCYVDCPVGHRIVRGMCGEFYPLSPAAEARTYEPASGVQA